MPLSVDHVLISKNHGNFNNNHDQNDHDEIR